MYIYVTAAASGTEYSGEVTTGDLLATCYSPVAWDTHVVLELRLCTNGLNSGLSRICSKL